MTLKIRRSNGPGMISIAPSTPSGKPVAIDNMDVIKSHNEPKGGKNSFRTLPTAAHLTETSSTDTLSQESLEDCAVVVCDESVEEPKPCFKPLVSATTSSRRRSILKVSNEEIPLNLKGKSFKSLPPPDMQQVKRLSMVSVETREEPTKRSQSNVGFATVEIREYNQTIGDNPSVSYGPPISLDWEYNALDSVDLEHYEAHRGPRRNMRQMMMNYYTRRNVLTYKCGFDEQQVKEASKQADKCKRERAVTKYFLPYSKVEDFVTSAGRKAKRGFKKNQAVAA